MQDKLSISHMEFEDCFLKLDPLENKLNFLQQSHQLELSWKDTKVFSNVINNEGINSETIIDCCWKSM